MCLSVPAHVVRVDRPRATATVDVLGATREASTMLLPDVDEGDWVLVHVGFAISKIDEAAAAEALALLGEALGAEGEA